MLPSIPVMIRRGPCRPAFTLIELLVVIAIIAILAAIIIPAVFDALKQARNVRDLEQVRGVGNAMTMYEKKYSYFPALVNMADSSTVKSISAARVGGKECLALKLLLKCGYVDDPRIFFSPRGPTPDDATLAAMQVELDPVKDPAFASTYAYDPGHNTNHGSTPFFGTPLSTLNRDPGLNAHVLTCDQTAKEMEPPPGGVWTFANRLPTGSATQLDNLYNDDSATFGWRDSNLYETAGTIGP